MKNEVYTITEEDLKIISDANDAIIEMLSELKDFKKKHGETEKYKASFERIKKISLALNSAYSAIGKSVIERKLKIEAIRDKFIILDKFEKLKLEIEKANRI